MVWVIGAGYWGRNLVRNFAELGALTGVTDPSAAARDWVAATYPGIPVSESPDAVFAKGLGQDVGAVVIATPVATHGSLVGRALAAGLHVFVEKPLCLDVAEAERLRDQARARGRVLMVGHLLQYHPAFQSLRQRIEAGALGALRYIYSNRASLGKIRREENAMWSFAPHDISMILALARAMPDRVVANGGSYLSRDVADTTLTHLTFADGLQAHIFVSWLHPYKEQRLVVVGTAGMLVFDDVAPGAGKLRLYPHRAGWEGDVPLIAKAEPEPIAYGTGEPLRAECEAFLKAVADGTPPPSDADEGIRVLKVLEAGQESLVSGRPVTLAAG